MDQIELEVAEREVLGKKVRFLRRQGITPVHLFGHGIESMALQCDASKLEQVLAQAGHTRLINLKVGKEKKARTAVVRHFEREWRRGTLRHVDFYQVKMTEKIRVDVPIILVGEAPALNIKDNMLSHELNTMTVECLPAKIPASIELDISSLTEPEQAIRVSDIELDPEITLLNDPELVVVKISVKRGERIEEAIEAPKAAPTGEEESTKE